LGSHKQLVFFRIESQSPVLTRTFMLAHTRARRPYAQQTHMIARCETDYESPNSNLVRLAAKDTDASFDFCSVSSVAKQWLLAGASTVRVREGTPTWPDLEANPVLVVLSVAVSRDLISQGHGTVTGPYFQRYRSLKYLGPSHA
jgi:hypothetical protein